MALRALALFWGALLIVIAGGAAVLQVLGPPRVQPAAAKPAEQAGSVRDLPVAPAPQTPVAPQAPPAAPVSNGKPGTAVPAGWDGQVREPDPALLEPAPDFPGRMLPRRGPDGLAPMQAYARPFDPADTRPRIGIVMDGTGLADADSRAAIEALPPAVDFALSAYTDAPGPLADLAREHGHEVLLSLPMEPQGYPMNDEGPRALLTGAAPADNERDLEWALSRFEGYAGATSASDGMQGERFAGMTEPFGVVARELAERGLFYVDGRPDAPPTPGLAGRSVNLILDQPPARAEIEAQLAKLERLARDKGSALGLAGPPSPVLVETVVAWARALEARGVVLAPASALSHAAEPSP
ncbi:MAG: divergent polysaccharide deacetylase family protein [Acetobacteraceae bacterium]|nr:divergent polysaccharide deacetylase family protein [Acetobacteraceae bacterium]